MTPSLFVGFAGGLAGPAAPAPSMLRHGQGLNASGPGGQPLRRCWINHPDGEEVITRLEDELLPAMESFLARIDAIDQQLSEAQAEQEAEVKRPFDRAANGSGC
jgi:hypothetical protein